MKRRKRNITIITIIIILGLAVFLMYLGNSANIKVVDEVDGMDTNTNIMTEKNTNGFLVEDLKVGEGKEAKKGDIVSVHYTGTFQDGTKFDSSLDRNIPFDFEIGVGSVIQGWDEGVPGMRVGGKRKLTIPSEMAYGATGQGIIPANATLLFDIELITIK